jgi:hypothetical protein
MSITGQSKSTSWQPAAQAYLARLGFAEYKQNLQAHIKTGRRVSTYRHNPSEYHRELVRLLGANDEPSFKAMKLEQGYASAVRV